MNDTMKMKKTKATPIETYDEMDASKKLSNIRQAKSYPYKLNLIGYEIVPQNNSKPKKNNFTEEEINFLSVIEHEDWCREKRNTRWISPKESLNNNLITEEKIRK